jgi:putative transposase
MVKPRQLPLPLPQWGGRRKGAGRPRTLAHPGLIGPGVPHASRTPFPSSCPVHVTQRFRPAVGNLRRQAASSALLRALNEARERFGARIVHYSIQGNHLHLIVESESAPSLGRAMQGLAIRIAKVLNSRLRRRGAVFADRYHQHVLRSPREVANAVRYVLANFRHHARERLPASFRDPLASSPEAPLAEPKRWLLRIAWWRERPHRQRFFEP